MLYYFNSYKKVHTYSQIRILDLMSIEEIILKCRGHRFKKLAYVYICTLEIVLSLNFSCFNKLWLARLLVACFLFYFILYLRIYIATPICIFFTAKITWISTLTHVNYYYVYQTPDLISYEQYPPVWRS